ncbi:MAG TPA: carboxypeptidase regulatory-like domain-containing protein [Acidobacteriaceae bacterium]|nr:carboxypeptidase regulatory-like domain-containing protein [Acidobacteriaceae bacterium]
MKRIFALVVVFCLMISIDMTAQTPDTATLQGQVVDNNHQVVAGVSITATNTLTGQERTGVTDTQGNFSLGGLPVAGSYDILATKSSFADAHVKGITLTGGGVANIHLQLGIHATDTHVTVTGALGEVQTDEPQLGDHLGPMQMEETPLLNRRITYLPLLNAANRPAINQGDVFMNQNLFNTNGSGRRQTWFEIDGSTGNDSWGRQTIFTNIPLASVQEMTVLENAFSAEYGFGLGSVVNIITKSGGNRLHGDVLGLWRPSAPEAKLSGFTTATATSGDDITNDTLGQGAASLSGPIGNRDRTHFFMSGQYSLQHRASPVTSPIAPGNFIGNYQSWLAFVRLDHQINNKNNLFLRSNADDFYDTNPNGTVGGNNLPSVDRIFRKRTYSEELGETEILSPTLLNNVRLQFQLASPITQFDPVINGTQFVVPISTGGVFTSGTSQSALLLNRQYEFNDVLATTWKRHQITFGGDVIRTHNGGNSKEYGGPIYDGQFVYNPCTLSLTVCESSTYLNNIQNVAIYTQSYGNANYTVDDTLWALFVQDDFHASSNMTINLGLRYEQQTFTDARKDFAPRIGFSYDVSGNGRTVVQAGFGIYYAQVVDNSEANYALTGPTGVFNYTAAPGQIGFPKTVQSAPLPSFPPGAVVPLRSLYIRPGQSTYLNQFFPTSTLHGYPDKLLNPYNEQWILGLQQELQPNWVLSMDYVGAHTLKNVRPLDVDTPAPFIRTAQGQIRTAQAANCSRPYWIEWYQQHHMTCNVTTPSNPQPPYSVIQSDVNDGYVYYQALDVNLSHPFSNRIAMLASYIWSHTIDNVDPDIPSQNPNDPNFTGHQENGDAGYDQRNRFVLSGTYAGPLKINLGGVATLASGLPYNVVTGSTNSGDLGATTDRPVINGVVIGRNTGHGGPIYDVEPFIERPFALGINHAQVLLRAEAFNILNHANFVGYSGTYGNGSQPGKGFGEPLTGVTNQLTARTFQFSADLRF